MRRNSVENSRTQNTPTCISSLKTLSQPACSKCGGSGWITVVTDRYPRGANAECDCLIFKKKMARIEALLNASMLGKRFRLRRFDNFIPGEGVKKAYDLALDYVSRYEDYTAQGRGLTFIAGVGRGKTHLAAAILHDLINNKQVPGALVCVPNLLDIFRISYDTYSESYEKRWERKRFSKNRIVRPHEVMETVSNIDFLVLDDLGAEKSSPWVIERLTMLVNDRYEKMLPTIVTTNLALSLLEEQVGERLFSRLVEMNFTVFMAGDDYRKREKSTLVEKTRKSSIEKIVGEVLDSLPSDKKEQIDLEPSKLSSLQK